MPLTVDLGQVLIAVTLAACGLQARAALAEIKALRIDMTRIERWAAKRGYEPRTES